MTFISSVENKIIKQAEKKDLGVLVQDDLSPGDSLTRLLENSPPVDKYMNKISQHGARDEEEIDCGSDPPQFKIYRCRIVLT